MSTLYRPELLYSKGSFVSHAELLVADDGRILTKNESGSPPVIVNLPGKALLPGFVNAHSHSFQRLIRGKSESRITSGKDFWSWRATMYHAASRLNPQEVYDVARMTFLEMLLAGTTTVGEFHYLHTAVDGQPYENPNLLSEQVLRAAQSVGIRIVLLRAAYLRSGYGLPRDPGQTRFFESTRTFVDNMSQLLKTCWAHSERVHFGVAPHSIRAVPLSALKEIAFWSRENKLPLHMHIAEQIQENEACVQEYGFTPVELLSRERLLGADLTAVHAVHINSDEIRMLADAGATICSCPTTERNLGDGILAADRVMRQGIPVALGSDSQAQIDPLEDARELDYHLRLQQQERAILDQIGGQPLAMRLFDCATRHGARALAIPAGDLTARSFADFVTIDLNDLSVAADSADDLLAMTVFSLNRSAIRDIVVNGKLVVSDQKHSLQDEIVSRYREVHQKVWHKSDSSEAAR